MLMNNDQNCTYTDVQCAWGTIKQKISFNKYLGVVIHFIRTASTIG